MPNRQRGEIEAVLDGRTWTLCLTLGALAELEASLAASDLMGLARRFETGTLTADDAIRVIGAGLRGAGNEALGGHADATVDLAAVERADSAGLALLVEWLRAARGRGARLRFDNVPAQLRAIAATSGLDRHIFEAVEQIKPSARGELEITHVNDAYITKGQMAYDILEGWWTDAGTFESLDRAGELVKNEPPL